MVIDIVVTMDTPTVRTPETGSRETDIDALVMSDPLVGGTSSGLIKVSITR